MKLIGSNTSPYVRKVRIVMAEKKLDYQFVLENVWAADTTMPDSNPLGKVPCLVMEGGEAVFDSRVIVEYLDNASPVARLIPDDTRARIQVRRWEALADGCTDAANAVVVEKRRPADKQSAEWISRQQGKIDRALKAMADELGARAWCASDHYTLADIAVGTALGYLDFRMQDINWRKEYPNLAKLSEKLNKRASFVDTVPPKS